MASFHIVVDDVEVSAFPGPDPDDCYRPGEVVLDFGGAEVWLDSVGVRHVIDRLLNATIESLEFDEEEPEARQLAAAAVDAIDPLFEVVKQKGLDLLLDEGEAV
ncbi:MAG: hypothetical protein JWO74_3146 [Solirubrobacterales bacterium]|nr:hypothetical protein [Solirubrobacterales bacterium]